MNVQGTSGIRHLHIAVRSAELQAPGNPAEGYVAVRDAQHDRKLRRQRDLQLTVGPLPFIAAVDADLITVLGNFTFQPLENFFRFRPGKHLQACRLADLHTRLIPGGQLHIAGNAPHAEGAAGRDRKGFADFSHIAAVLLGEILGIK